MYRILNQEHKDIESIFSEVVRQASLYLHGLDQRPTSVADVEGPAPALPTDGIGTCQAIHEFLETLESRIVSSSGPRYWGFVTGGSTPAAIAGDWLASVYDQNPQSTQGQGDVSAIIEQDTIRLMLELLALPDAFLGGFVTGATMSNFTCIGVARQWLGKKLGVDIARQGVPVRLPVLTATAHSSAIKSMAMLGMGSNTILRVSVLPGNREAMDMDDLERAISTLNGQPFILLTSGGTVNTVDYDDLQAIAALRSKYDFWWHIDAAFGAFAVLSDNHRHLLSGWEQADSITIDNHKWLNVPYESAIFLVRKEHRHLQVETFQNSNAPYLGDPMENFSYLNFLPENSRRLKALPVWFTLKAYGKEGYRAIIQNNISLAHQFGEFIERSEAFELLAPVRLNTVCFSLNGPDKQEQVQPFLKALNDTGKVFMTPTFYQGKKGIRAAFVNWMTSEKDIELVSAEMDRVYAKLFENRTI